MSMTLVLANQTPHPWFGWLGIKRRTTPIFETLDEPELDPNQFGGHGYGGSTGFAQPPP